MSGIGVTIENRSDGIRANVTTDGQLSVQAETLSLQHYISAYNANAYQVIGTTTISATANTILHLKNTDTENSLVVSYIRMGVIDPAGGTALPSANTYFSMGYGTTYTSGGTAATAINTNARSGNTASVDAYQGSPVVGGTYRELDRRYVKAEGDEYTYSKDGSLILGLNNTFEIRLQSDHTSGTAIARATFMMIPRVSR